jgi:hypothetical protein
VPNNRESISVHLRSLRHPKCKRSTNMAFARLLGPSRSPSLDCCRRPITLVNSVRCAGSCRRSLYPGPRSARKSSPPNGDPVKVIYGQPNDFNELSCRTDRVWLVRVCRNQARGIVHNSAAGPRRCEKASWGTAGSGQTQYTCRARERHSTTWPRPEHAILLV